jgi:hypothetical protein
MHVRRLALIVALAAIAVVAGCDNSSPFRAQFPNILIPRKAWAMNGTPAALPSAVSMRVGSVVNIDPSWQFDFAFDMDAIGVVKVHSARSVATELSPVNRVGFRIDSVNAFANITQAPTSGYVYDSVFTLAPGRTLLIDVFDVSCQRSSFLGVNIRGKLIIDSIDVADRSISFRLLANRNCGFRSLVEGLPKD